jgi:hypothetical protein
MAFNLQTHFQIERQSDNLFQFSTSSEIYSISLFDSTNSLIGYPGKIYELSFWPINKTHFCFDERISNTILYFTKELLELDPSICISFVCDSSDNKELIRKRLFHIWYSRFENGYIKLDTEIKDNEGPIYYHSLITSQNNPYLSLLNQLYTNEIMILNNKLFIPF